MDTAGHRMFPPRIDRSAVNPIDTHARPTRARRSAHSVKLPLILAPVLLPVVVLVLGVLAIGSAHADPGPLLGPGLPSSSASPLMQSLVEPARITPQLTQDEAALAVQQQTGGRVLSTVPGYRGDATGYEVRVLVDGKRVRTVFVDGQGNLYGAD